MLNPDLAGAYSWWSYRFNARKNNAGWRIDYFLVSEGLRDAVSGASIHADVMEATIVPCRSSLTYNLRIDCNTF